MGCYGIATGTEEWQIVVREAIHKWTGQGSVSRPKNTNTAAPPRGAAHNAAVLRAAGFDDTGSFQFTHPYVWSLDSIIGNLYSTSICSRKTLGKKTEPFEDDLRRALLECDSQGRYPETIRFGYTLGRKPGRVART